MLGINESNFITVVLDSIIRLIFYRLLLCCKWLLPYLLFHKVMWMFTTTTWYVMLFENYYLILQTMKTMIMITAWKTTAS